MTTKSLTEMSLEELWQLFPIELTHYDPEWPRQAGRLMASLHELLDGFGPTISHIGSTAVAGLLAKPIVDILVETADTAAWPEIVRVMESAGYVLMARSAERMSFNRGYTPQGFADEVFHIHFHLSGDNDEVLFRDYLIGHPSVAASYAKLKLTLAPTYRHDRDGYTEAKTEFIRAVVAEAKRPAALSAQQIEVARLAAGRCGLRTVMHIALWATAHDANRDFIWRLSESADRRTSLNALWVMTHYDSESGAWLRGVQDRLILRLLDEEDASRKRIVLQILRRQEFDCSDSLVMRLLDYCLSKINSECEPYAVRASSLYIAYNISRDYPELVSELNDHLDYLAMQSLSPGLRSAMRQTLRKITRRNRQRS